MYLGWNDYELIYLIKEGNELALNLMYHKYSNFIRIKARELGFRGFDLDDCIQEGLLLLTKAIKTFNNDYNKSFWSYFNLILKRHLWRYQKKWQKQEYALIDDNIKDNNTFKETILEYSSLFKDEMLSYIYEEIFYYNTPIREISRKLGVKSSKIYLELKKIKEILRIEFDL